MEWYFKVLNNYFGFTGRARRKEFWMFFLFHVLFGLFAISVDLYMGNDILEANLYSLYYIYFFATLIPSISVGIRRLHDAGRNSAWILLSIIPILGPLILLILYTEPGQPFDNKFGPNPKTSGIPKSEDTEHEN